MLPCNAKNYNLVLVKQLVMDKDRPTEMTSPCSQVPPGADNPEQAPLRRVGQSCMYDEYTGALSYKEAHTIQSRL